MNTTNLAIDLLSSLHTRSLAKKIRMDLNLSKKEIAKLAKVSVKSVDLLENDEPLRLDCKLKILAALYREKLNAEPF